MEPVLATLIMCSCFKDPGFKAEANPIKTAAERRWWRHTAILKRLNAIWMVLLNTVSKSTVSSSNGALS